MRLVYAPSALRDIEELLAFIHEKSPQGASKVSFAIEHTAMICAEAPGAGSPTDVPHVYRWPLSSYRFTIFYRHVQAEETVEIIRVVRASRIRNLRRVPVDE